MNVELHRQFKKQFKKLSSKTQQQFLKRLELFIDDSYHPQLRNHQLSGKWQDFRSINITGDIRAVYQVISPDTVYFIAIGTHSELYR